MGELVELIKVSPDYWTIELIDVIFQFLLLGTWFNSFLESLLYLKYFLLDFLVSFVLY